ncbi:MAG: NAD-dependent epimerase/dehydratase family protein [Polyangiales bacterium]
MPSSEDRLVLVTGASGYSGRFLVERLLDRGFSVRAFDRRRHPELDPRATFVEGDLTRPRDVEAAVQGVATVFHLAAIVPFGLAHSVSDVDLDRVNVGGTYRLVHASRRAGVRRFVLASSTGVVFAGESIARGDESIPVPRRHNDAYSRTKAEAERIVLGAATPRFATLAIRPNGIWGPGEEHHIPKVLMAARAGLDRFTFGDDALTDFTHRENLVHAFLLAEEKLRTEPGRVSGKAYFVTDGEPMNTFAFFRPLVVGLGYPPPLASVPGKAMLPVAFAMEAAARLLRPLVDFEPPLTRADVRKCIAHNYFDSSRAANELGYAPVIDHARGMAECIAYYRARGFAK